MILSYIQKPSSLTLTYATRDKEVQALNWSEINQHTYSDSTLHQKHIMTSGNNDEIHRTIARLIRQIGENMRAFYVPGFTFIDSSKIIDGLTKTCSDAKVSALVDYSDATQMLQTMQNTPGVYYMMGEDENDDRSIHSWIYDGGYTETIGYRGTNWQGQIITGTRSSSFSHFRWGFGGLYDGYFYPGVFSVNNKKYSNNVRCFFVQK